MYLFILIFFIVILILQVNVHIFFKSMADTVKMYMKIGPFHIEIPHHKLLLGSKKMKNFKVKEINKLTNIFLSHSVLDHFYISRSSSIDLAKNGISNALYLIVAYELKGLLFSKCRLVENNEICLRYDEAYENIDYYFDIHISIINIIIVSIKSIFKR